MILREILHAHAPTLSTASTVRDAVDKMDVYQFCGLAVLDDEMRPAAVITEGDLARAVTARGNLVGIAAEPAILFASREPTTATPDQEVGEALHLMLSRGLTVLPIVEDGVYCGVVLRVDLMQAVLIDVAASGRP